VVDLDASSWSLWWFWVDWHHSSVIVPSVVVESVPSSTSVLVDVAIVMPVAGEPSPSSTESTSGWSVVVPLAILPSVPDATIELPVGGWLDALLAPLADDVVSLVGENPLLANSFSAEDLSVLSSDLGMVLIVGSIELEQGFIIQLLVVLAERVNVLSLLKLGTDIVFWDDFIGSCKSQESHHDCGLHMNLFGLKLINYKISASFCLNCKNLTIKTTKLTKIAFMNNNLLI
jgi:hypothetical protein